VPEVALDKLDHEPGAAGERNAARTMLLEQVWASREQTRVKPPAGFIEQLERNRPDLAGLPFRKGKDCLTTRDHAEVLASWGRKTRAALFPVCNGPPLPDSFWRSLNEGALPTLQQLLLTESAAVRRTLVDYLQRQPGKAFSLALAQRVIFDLDEGVRTSALAALQKRPSKEYLDVLLDALRYPWVSVGGQAAEALVGLKLKQAIPSLVSLLDERDPGAPFLATVNGRKVLAVRELVRINHHRNCLLCHPTSADPKEPVRGRVPMPGERLPDPGYNGESPHGIFVRADITYLRQDFSLLEKVEDHGIWPAQQRFDYLVRTRPLTAAEREAWWAVDRTQQPVWSFSKHRQAVLFALRELTGRDAGVTAEEWRQALREIQP